MFKIKEILKNKKYFSIIIILIASIFVCIPLINKNIDMTYDDGVQHICRLIGTFQSLQDGQAAIMSDFCNGFGYSWNLFYSPLTAYLPLIFKILGVSFATCIKLFMFLVVFLSGYFMYLFVKKLTKNNNIAIIASIFYILAPYRITDMYVRNALAELTSFVFLPLVFLGVYNLFNLLEENKDYKRSRQIYIPLIIGAVGLMLTHTVITMYTAIFALIYVLINIKKLKDKRNLKILILSGLLILIITSFFWAPLLELKNSADYEVFKEGRMERIEVLIAYKLDFYRLFFTKNTDYMIYEIGIITLFGLILTPLAIKKIKQEKYYKLYLFMLISGIICAIMTLKIFPFEHLPKTLKMLQFTFRLLEFTSFFFAVVGAINIGVLSKNLEIKEVLILLILMILVTIPFTSHLRKLEDYDEQRLIDTVPVTENTGRVHAGCASFEYLPSKAFENRNYIETRNQDVIVISGKAQIENQIKEGLNMACDVKYVLEETEIELPYIYYIGYNVKLEVNGEEIKLDTFETDKGFVGVKIPILEEGKIKVEYTGTTLMNVSSFISLIGVCMFLGMLIQNKKNRK